MATFHTPYLTERDGQIEFFENYGIPYDKDTGILSDNTDGVYNGIIFEFKPAINDLNKTLFQAVKYLSSMRIKGRSIPATILLVSLNTTTAYLYHSEDYIEDIQKIYFGSASKNNEGFVAGSFIEKLDYSDTTTSAHLKHLIKDKKNIHEMFMPIDIDENCIVGWAQRYYSENPNATKGDFLGDDTGTRVKITGEIREPKHFEGLINPYNGKTNEKFKYLMDCLNDRLSKKDLGAFYTPEPYCRKAVELVKMAVDRVPDGNDYIILDRCAGTGNLESALIGVYDKNGDELITHSIVSTYEYYEYKVLEERFADAGLREIIPPSEADVIYANGRVSNADAMSKEYIENPLIRKYVDNPKCTIILFENPPYSDSSAITFNEGGDSTKRVRSEKGEKFVVAQFKKKALPSLNEQRGAVRESSNLFIWSGFEYFCRYPTDSYIVFSPVKYFKNIGLPNKKFVVGFAFNRKYFHASESVISCVLWSNEDDTVTTAWNLTVFDIKNDDVVFCEECKNITIRKSFVSVAGFNDKRQFPTDEKTNLVCNSDGTELPGWFHKTKQSVYNTNIIAYMAVNGFTPDAKHRYLMRCGYRGGIEQSYGFMVRNDNYIDKLPLWVSKMFPDDSWFEKDVYNNTSDGGDAYTKDQQFLKSCLIYTCLSNQNKCLSFDGSDGRRYQNELCFDDSITANPDITSCRKELPIALKDLTKYAKQKDTSLNNDEKELLELWNKIMNIVRKTKEYNAEFNYGVYQITKELNTYTENENGKKEYNYPELNGHLRTLRVKLKEYYKSHISEKMFEYELLK